MGVGSSKPAFRALLLGLDAAGKTTLLKGLTGQDIQEGPTTNHNVGTLKLKKGDALIFDLGGQQKYVFF
jgi:GTPase SAR1 family protein